jgi:hypothetical protein
MATLETTSAALTDNQKLQHIHASKRLKRQWIDLSKEEKRHVLAGMDLGVNQTWVAGLIEEVLEMRKEHQLNS